MANVTKAATDFGNIRFDPSHVTQYALDAKTTDSITSATSDYAFAEQVRAGHCDTRERQYPQPAKQCLDTLLIGDGRATHAIT